MAAKMFHKLEHEMEEICEEVEEKAEELCKEAEEEAVHICKEAEEEAAHICKEAEEMAEGAEEEVCAAAHHLAGRDKDKDDNLQNIRRSLTAGGAEDSPAEKHFIVDSMWFQVSVTAMTMANTVQMGLEVDHSEWTTLWLICENVFTAGFALEMLIKLCVFRWHYFTDSANWLDGSLSVFGVLDCWILELILGGGGVDLQSLSVLRILRLLRLARILKLMRSVKPLVLVIQGVMKAMSTAIYVLILCILIFYVFAIFLTQHMGQTNNDLYPGYSTDEDIIDEQEFMANYNPYICFGSMLSSMLTLFNMAILAEWSEIVRPVFYKQPLYLPVFLFFATCVGFGVMNVLIAVIVDVVTAESRRIETDYNIQQKNKKLKTLDKIQTLLSDIDRNKDGVMEEDELAYAMENNDRLKELMACINLPRGWASNELLDMLDNNGDGVLQYGEFTTSFFRLLDSDDFQQICIMQSSINQVKHLIKEQNKKFGATHYAIERDLASIKAALGIPPGIVSKANKASFRQPSDGSPRSSHSQQQSNEACNQNCNTGNLEFGELSNTVREITKEELVGSKRDGHKPQENELMLRAELKEVLSSALIVVKECIHEEFAAVKPGLQPQITRSAPSYEFYPPLTRSGSSRRVLDESSSVEGGNQQSPSLAEPWNQVEIPVRCLEPTKCTDGWLEGRDGAGIANNVERAMPDSKLSTNKNSSNAELANEFPGSANGVAALRAQYERSEYSGTYSFAALSNPVGSDPVTEGRTHQAAHLQYRVHDFTFDEETQRLGFEVQWVKDGFPLVAAVVPDGAANMQGLLQGDQISECNGMATVGKDRQTVLQALGRRPLVLSILRA